MFRAYLELLRPANVATAAADVLAGAAVSGLGNRGALPWLLLSTTCLYAGGVVLNDVFDREVDRIERPERPIPSGRARATSAAALGIVLLAAGTLAAFAATTAAGLVATALAGLIGLYDGWGKRHAAVAPVNMGACRALNLVLGMAAVPAVIPTQWPLALIPLAYIGGVTTLSRGEVHGGRRGPATIALVCLALAWGGLLVVALRAGVHAAPAAVLAAAAGWRVLPPFWAARESPTAPLIRQAVRRGVLSLVLVDATIAAAYAGPIYSVLVLATGLIAGVLARLFAVT